MSEKGGAAESPHLSHAEVAQLWAKFRAGDVIYCPRDSVGMALAVDGSAKIYRIVCTQCGLASPWFGTTPAGLVFRGPGATLGPKGEPFTDNDIGSALATRELLDELRQGGTITGGPRPMTPKDRSRFLSKLDEMVNAVRRAASAQ